MKILTGSRFKNTKPIEGFLVRLYFQKTKKKNISGSAKKQWKAAHRHFT
jgi:hypothetical protein